MAQVCDLAIFALLYHHRKFEAMRTEKAPTLIVLHEETPVFTSHSDWPYPLLEPDRPAIAKEVRELIRAMWQANPTWGSRRIIRELRTLGIAVAKSMVEKYRGRSRTSPSPTSKAFLKTHIR